MNRDAALDKTVKKMARYDYANVLAEMATVIPYINDPAVAKSMAAWRVINMCSELRFQQVSFEGDSLLVVLALARIPPTRVVSDKSLRILDFGCLIFHLLRYDTYVEMLTKQLIRWPKPL